MPVYGVGHGHQFGIALIVIAIVPHVIQPVDLERRARQQHGLAGFLIDLGDAQINFDFLVQYRKFLITVRACHYAALGRCHGTPRVVILCRINAHKERLCLIQILRGGGFYHEVGAIGQPLYADVAGVTAEDFGQLVFVGVAGGLPAVTLAVLVFSGSGQSLVVGGDLSGVDLVGFGNGLHFVRKIPFQMRIVIAFVNIGIQNALQRVGTGAGLVKLTRFGKVRYQIEGESGVFQFQTIGLPAGGNDLADLHIALGNLILTFGKGVVCVQVIVRAIAGFVDLLTGSLPVIAEGGFFHIPALIGISGCDVIVVLIAQITVGKGKRISIIGPTAVQCLALGNGAELVFVHPIGVLPAAAGQCRDLPGGCLGAAVHGGIGAGNSKSALTQRNDRAGGALYHIIFAEVQVCEGQPAVLDFGAGYQMVLFENWQIIRYPLPAVVADGRVPEGITVGIHDFGIIHNTGYAVRMGDVLGSVEVVHGTVQRGVAVICNIFPGVQIHLGNADFAQSAVVFHLAVRGGGGVAVLVGGFSAVVGVISAGRIFGGAINGYGSFHATTGHQLGAALVGCQDVSVVIGIVQPKHRIIVGFGDFDIVTALAQRSVGHAGMIDVCPIAKIACGRFGFHDDKLARITLCVVEGVAHGIRGGIGGAVDDCIAATSLTLHAVGVVAPGGLVFAGHHIPLIDLILGIGGNRVAGFAVGFLEVDLQTPLVIFHNIVVVGVCGYRDRLAAAVRAPVFAESIRYRDFFIAELDAAQLRFGRCYSVVDSVLGLTLQFRNC